MEACRAYWNYYVAGKGISRFIGATIVDVGRAECEYTHYLHLCPEESGGGAFDCNTILPVDVFYECQLVGYHLSDAGRCVADRVREPMQCDEPDGQFGGNPILFVSGSKTETRTDFATADGRLSVQRFYRSLKQRWHSLAALNSAFNAEPLGQVGGWGFGFAMEWHLEKTRIALSSSNPGGALYLPDGTAHHYAYHSGFTPNSHNPNSKYKVEFVGVLPSVWSTLFDVSSQWRVTDLKTGRVWLLKTFAESYNKSRQYTVARPIKITDADGYVQNLIYGSKGEVLSVTDSYGRTLGFTWRNYTVTTLPDVAGGHPVPEALQQVTLPDGGRSVYSYDLPVTIPSDQPCDTPCLRQAPERRRCRP